MIKRIAVWASLGFAVAALWAVFVLASFPDTNERIAELWPLVCLTLPIAMLRHHPISVYQTLVANAVTYGVVGLIVEMKRRLRPLRHI